MSLNLHKLCCTRAEEHVKTRVSCYARHSYSITDKVSLSALAILAHPKLRLETCSSSAAMTVEGFHIKEDGTRVSMSYSSHAERIWCECGELLDQELYEEAYKIMDEYHDINNRWIDKSDFKLVLKVEMGYLSVKPTKANIKTTVDVWRCAAAQDMGSNADDFARMAVEIIEHYAKKHKIPVDYDEFGKANVKQTVKLLEFIYSSFLEPGADLGMNLEEYEFLEPTRFGIRHLAMMGEKEKARAFYDKVTTAGYGGYKREMEESKAWMMNEED